MLACSTSADPEALEDLGETVDRNPNPVPLVTEPLGKHSPVSGTRSSPAGVSLVDDNGDCPGYAGWSTGTQMFVDGSEELKAENLTSGDIPDILTKFCLYQLTTQGSIFQAAMLSVDHADVEPQSAWPSPLDTELEELFLAQVGMVHDGFQAPHTVRVAVLDTRSSFPESTPLSDHAASVASIVGALVHAGPASPITIHNALALPVDVDGTLRDPGGAYYGDRAHVAMGLMKEVVNWRREVENLPPQTPATPLVINLSIGWVTASSNTDCNNEAQPWCDDDPDDPDAQDDPQPMNSADHVGAFQKFVDHPPEATDYETQIAVEALHGALLYAACQGALIIAAAGNAKDGSCNEEPVAPAVWARYSAPTSEQCHTLGFSPPQNIPPSWTAGSRPLVYPIAAIDHENQPIAVTRPGSMTQLVAAGAHVVTDENMAPMTGTSAAAAVASAAAALVWSHEPDMGPEQVMDIIHEGASLTTLEPMLRQYGAFGSTARRISLCGALDVLGESSAQGTTCSATHPLDSAIVGLDAAVNGIVPSNTTNTIITSSATAAAMCNACDEHYRILPSVTTPAAGYLFSSCGSATDTEPQLAGPQPDLGVCPECPLVLQANGAAEAHLALASTYQNDDLIGAWLELEFANANPVVFDLASSLTSLKSHLATVLLPVSGLPGTVTRATLGLRIEGIDGRTYTRSNQLYIKR